MKQRTHLCGDLRKEHAAQQSILYGWVHRRRDHGGVIFVDLRDYTGVVQVVFSPEETPEAHQTAQQLRSEFVIGVEGQVRLRTPDTVNRDLPTGEIEVVGRTLSVLNKARTAPFRVEDDTDAGEDLRLRYRYLDLRRPTMQRNLRLRHRVCLATREYFDRAGFIEVETPVLIKSTPEGARDYLVPSRMYPGKFYALPQSPQLLKQLLMVSGADRYFQIARCYRDEDLRADRQPEFTQIDVEMSFVDEDSVIQVSEGMMAAIYKALDREIAVPFKRLSYEEALNRFGTDKPDIRFGMELADVTEIASASEFRVFREAVESGGVVKGICAPGYARASRKELDDLTRFVAIYGAKGLAWIKLTANGFESPIKKFFTEGQLEELGRILSPAEGDVLLFVADIPRVVTDALANLRLKLGEQLQLIPHDKDELVWVLDFPLFEQENGTLSPQHHPFTAPREQDIDLLETDPLLVHARAYDMVLNGTEIGGGSIRIHDAALQQRIFKVLGVDEQDAHDRFGFLLEAFSYGAPPHGGIAFGLDRIVMLLAGETTIRDVIAFPKTQKGACLLTGAPSAVAAKQLKELGVKIDLG
jgi:aspartyl-tRNA synthetase